MSKYVSTLIYILSFSITILAASPIDFSGTIVDSKNRDPLIGANVILSKSDKQIGAATDEFGNYLISNIKFGKYDLIVSYIGYDDFRQELVFNSSTDEKFKLDIALKLSSLFIDEYVVTASRGKREKITDAPAAISIISERKIRTASNPNLGDYFKNIKGVDFTASGIDSYNLCAR